MKSISEKLFRLNSKTAVALKSIAVILPDCDLEKAFASISAKSDCVMEFKSGIKSVLEYLVFRN